MYKLASQYKQEAAERIRLHDIPAAPVILTDEQRRQNLVSIVKRKRAEHAACKSKDRRRELGQEIASLDRQIHAIRPKSHHPDLAQYFMRAAEERLSKFEFDLLMKEAVIRSGRKPVDSTG